MERKFDCNVFIVDEPMGRGKTSAAINYINSTEDSRFLVITPYLKEVAKYKKLCRGKAFVEPDWGKGSKLCSLKDYIRDGRNIVSTHALFQRFDNELIELCKMMGYTLIMDEVTQVVDQFDLSHYDEANLLENYVYTEEDTHLMHWKDEAKDYTGIFSDIKRLCDMESLAVYGNDVAMWLFPIQAFNAFKVILILTYMFHAQIQRYYYDYYKLPYSYLHVDGDDISNYSFSVEACPHTYDYANLITVLEHTKLNDIGNVPFSLSKSWYDKALKSVLIKQLKDNVYNFFYNIARGKSEDNMWTTFKSHKPEVSGKGYTKGFLELNARATNQYREKKYIAYTVNVFLNPVIKQFFLSHGVEVDEEGYALSEMLQFIWRSAIRDGKPITVYVPSYRMRKLLTGWIKENSVS